MGASCGGEVDVERALEEFWPFDPFKRPSTCEATLVREKALENSFCADLDNILRRSLLDGMTKWAFDIRDFAS